MGKGERFKENKNSILTKKFIIKNIISFIMFIFFLALFILSGTKVINYIKDARNNKELYAELSQYTKENEDNTSNGEMRKASFDSQNELSYNKQDIIDIVGKLKEIDTKYNMFFNDEDKRNLRIIIDYLKKKI